MSHQMNEPVPNTDHVITGEGGAMVCLHCGARYAMALPCPIDVYVAASRAYVALHAHCEKQ